MITILTVVGARPQFIKLAPVAIAINRFEKSKPDSIRHIIVHTGQHYDALMSDVFFEELGISKPDYNLEVGSGSHAEQTGAIMAKLEKILNEVRPDKMVVFGDTNSTLAGALTASKMNIAVAHVEAGLRSYNRTMPEEINRIITDQVSDLLLCPTENAKKILQSENITRGVYVTGDVMLDAAILFSSLAEHKSDILKRLKFKPKSYFLCTVHRAENTDNPERLRSIFDGLSKVDGTILLPAHPRLKKSLLQCGLNNLPQHICFIPPVSFLDMIMLEKNARKILTDSGGVQKEAFFYKIPCITMRDETEWVETLKNDCNILTGTDSRRIAENANNNYLPDFVDSPFGDGRASEKIVTLLTE